MTDRVRARRMAAALLMALGAFAGPAEAQLARVHEQFYMPAGHNWVFRRNYPMADRLFNAFDYGHAVLYEELYTRPNAPVSEPAVICASIPASTRPRNFPGSRCSAGARSGCARRIRCPRAWS